MNLNVLATVILAAAASGGGKNADGTVTPYTLQDAATATGNGDYVAVNAGVGTTFVLDVTITDTATITVEVSNDNSSWQTIGAVRLTTGAIVSTITASGGYQVPASGWNYLRARISAFTAGSVTVKVQRSLFALVFKSSTVASSDMPDPYVPVDGTMNVTGVLTASDGVTLTSADIPDPYTPGDGTWNVTGSVLVTSVFVAGDGVGVGTRIGSSQFSGANISAKTDGVSLTWMDASANALGTFIDNGTTGILEVNAFRATDSVGQFQIGDTNVRMYETGTNDMTLAADGADRATLNSFGFTLVGIYAATVQSVSQSGADTLTPTSSYIEIDCSNAGGCAQTFSETGAVEGEIVLIKNLASSTGAVTVADSAGVQMVAGASISLGDDDIVWFVYDGTAWNQAAAVLAIE